MQNESSDSLRVIWLDREKVLEELRRAVEALAASQPEVEEVLLFGSLARGDAVPGSDADLLVILSRSPLPFLDRIPQYTPSGCGIGVDVFPYTREEMERMRREGHPFLKHALEEGVVLFRRA